MRVVRFHPQGLPASELYTIEIYEVRQWLRPGVENAGRWEHRARSFSDVELFLNRLKPTQALVASAIDSSCFRFAGVTAFGSKRAYEFLMHEWPSAFEHLAFLREAFERLSARELTEAGF